MSERPTPETDNNEYAHLFIEQNGYESPLQESPEEWADFARRLERERDAERALADRLAEALRPLLIATWREKQPSKAELAFAAWKEARND